MYIGRFAPSPTGPLHFGSLVAAVASYCEAKLHHGKWLLRMEDLDKPREVKGAATTILNQLEAFGFEWDGAIIYQSQRNAIYAAALDALKEKQLVYPCTCTRKEIADSSNVSGIEGAIYPKTCLLHAIKKNAPCAWRIKTPEIAIAFDDAIQGNISQCLQRDIGDFILKRADGFFAYQLAVVVDDAEQGVSHIVRGADLLDSTPRQIFLQQMLNYTKQRYAHVPLACNASGEKLSKQTLAAPLATHYATVNLYSALEFLGQNPPANLQFETTAILWEWALQHWQLSNVPAIKSLSINRSV